MLDSTLIQKAKADFDRDGFAVIRGYIEDQKQELINDVDRYIREVLPHLPEKAAFYEDKEKPESLFRLEGMGEYDSAFQQLIHNERYTSLAGCLLEDTLKPQQAELFGKAPRIGNPTPPHQDGYYFRLEPNEALTFWLPVDPADEENGCVRFVQGSHRRGMRPHARSDVFGFSLGVTDYGHNDERMEVPICVEPGDLVVHHSMTIHRADGNPTDRLRRAIGLVYYAARAKKNVEESDFHRDDVYEQWRKEGKL